MGRIIGIDLGTTNSSAAYWSRRRPKPLYNTRFQSPLTPSVVAYENGKRFVGQDAKDRRLSGSKNVIYSIKRFIGRDFDDPKTQRAMKLVSYNIRKSQNGEVEVELGGKYYSPVEISAMILQQIKADAELELGEEVSHAVITVPAYFGQRQKNATRQAGKLAGLHVLRVINEPTAAALSFGIDESRTEPQFILVYDLGGGTFDISVMMVSGGNFEVLAVDGNNFLGGDDFDNLILEQLLGHLQQEYGEDFSENEVVKSLLKGHAEQAKIQLSREESYRVVAAGIATTRQSIPVNLDLTLNRTDFETLISPLIEGSIDLTNQALRHAGLSAGEIHRVLLVGGSTRIPLVRRRLKEVFGDRIEIDVDPMQCVALGAAIQTAIPIDWMCTNCNTVNEGVDSVCKGCGQSPEKEDQSQAMLLCEACGKSNRQGNQNCWNCGSPIGAVIEFEFASEVVEPTALRIGDITSKYLGVEVEGTATTDGQSRLKIIIPKGTPYPTHEPFRHELYTSQTDQTLIRLPVYESEEEDTPQAAWELIGTVFNDRIPPGIPANTPVIVEMRIDQDGILTVASYLKRMKEESFSKDSLHFTGHLDEDASDDEIAVLGLYAFAMNMIGGWEGLNRFLESGQAQQALNLEKKAQETIKSRDKAQFEKVLAEIKEFVQSLPLPTWDLFLAFWAMNWPQISILERKKTEETITRMEQAAARQNFDLANQHLQQLREQINLMMAKIPSNLLKAERG